MLQLPSGGSPYKALGGAGAAEASVSLWVSDYNCYAAMRFRFLTRARFIPRAARVPERLCPSGCPSG